MLARICLARAESVGLQCGYSKTAIAVTNQPMRRPFHRDKGGANQVYQGWLVGPTVNSLTLVSSGMSSAKATTSAMRSGEMPKAS